ncbi:recombinase family protein [Listeria booriae]|uniref:Recombinase family protein n=1 Tax=Listeria booriae TaxID=1552123 RepID=A0A7X0ZWM7_9LIST|nr:recombinase family protein [Listeria booriae]MBC1227653.1 recombinase family protein [Listeria booriae]MBC1234530.1 recombinase family protein [Listeria booriae]MBC1246794.1 recombinase family protein [Listeria booriae]MBC1359169.1 recombinase family protein [Listeria booriae]MBC2163841.1 recombinase family protein [Listeria booriae]
MAKKIGYARVSTRDQKLDMQMEALGKFGCTEIYKEKQSGKERERVQLKRALAKLKPGDSFIVFKLDRLGRTTRQLLELIEDLQKREIVFISLQDSIDTSTSMGKFIFTVMSAFAEMEADLIRERTIAGIKSARLKGNIGGRPKLSKEKIGLALELYQEKSLTVKEISRQCGVAESTLYKYARRHNIKRNSR